MANILEHLLQSDAAKAQKMLFFTAIHQLGKCHVSAQALQTELY